VVVIYVCTQTPPSILGSAVENGGNEPVGSLKLEVEQWRFGRSEAVFRFGGNEDHIARADFADALGRFHSSVAFHDEVEVLAVLMEMIRGRRALFVAHDPGQHIVDFGQFLVNEERSFAPRDG
jgi:hypothetical protein